MILPDSKLVTREEIEARLQSIYRQENDWINRPRRPNYVTTLKSIATDRDKYAGWERRKDILKAKLRSIGQ